MGTPTPPIVDPRFGVGDTYQADDGPLLTRDDAGRWCTAWGPNTLTCADE
jgi:hypothetical protein